MIQNPKGTIISNLYEADETAWLERMADLIHQGRLDVLDYPHLGEYLSDMARRDRREVESRLATLLTHILKWVYQPENPSRSWQATIVEQRHELARLLARGVLRNHAEAVLADLYKEAVERAAVEAGLAPKSFPVVCHTPWSNCCRRSSWANDMYWFEFDFLEI